MKGDLKVNWLTLTVKKTIIASNRIMKVSLLKAFSLPIKKLTKNLYVSYDSGQAADGTGAQLQRLITIAALCKFFNLGFIPSKINDFSVHPLDPFQSSTEYLIQLQRLNNFLNFPHSCFETIDAKEKTLLIPRLTINRFFFELFRQLLNPKPRELVIFEAYPVTEFCPGLFDKFACEISENIALVVKNQRAQIVIHYRQGVGGNVIYPGQKIPRQIELAKIAELLRYISARSEFNPKAQITILTDAPDKVSFYSPPESQQLLWEGTPGYANGVMTIQPMDFSELSLETEIPINVIRGGNPLDAITLMAMADIFVMSKSSLSYVGALLNKHGAIYYPKSFWHRPMRHWIEFDG